MRRLLAAFAIVLAVLTIAFVAVHLAPGTPFMPRGDQPPLDSVAVARLNTKFGLDQPLTVQYARYLGALAHGELGQSFSQRRPVSAMLTAAIPNTILLAGTALAIDFLLGTLIGVLQAVHARRRWDSVLTNVTLIGYSLPTFWLGLVLLLVFGEWLHWFPIGGVVDPVMHNSMGLFARIIDRLHHLMLPALTLGIVGAAGTARFQRAATLEVLGEGYIRTARAKGLAGRQILWRHAFRNSLLPGITLLGLSLPLLLTGAVVVESVFAWPGMGRLAADAIASRDYPVVMATTLLASVMVVFGSLIADILYAVVDPRARTETRR